MYKCPHCEVEIDHLLYQEGATIYGTFDIETQDYEQDESEADGNTRYECPECNERINSINDLIDTTEEIRERERRRLTTRFTVDSERPRPMPALDLSSFNTESESAEELPVPPAIDQNWRGEYSGFNNSHNRQKQSAILTCPKCGSKNEAIENETVECYKCGKEINTSTAKKVTQVEKPNNPNF